MKHVWNEEGKEGLKKNGRVNQAGREEMKRTWEEDKMVKGREVKTKNK